MYIASIGLVGRQAQPLQIVSLWIVGTKILLANVKDID